MGVPDQIDSLVRPRSEPEPAWTPAHVRAARANAGEAARDVRSGGSETSSSANSAISLGISVAAVVADATPDEDRFGVGHLFEMEGRSSVWCAEIPGQ